MKYPVRCQILDVTGQEVFLGIVGKTPDVSKPHVGEFGLAERLPDGNVQITLDAGGVLMGYECWWKPVVNDTCSDCEEWAHRLGDLVPGCPKCTLNRLL